MFDCLEQLSTTDQGTYSYVQGQTDEIKFNDGSNNNDNNDNNDNNKDSESINPFRRNSSKNLRYKSVIIYFFTFIYFL